MGSAITSLFGGGYETPEPVQYDPVPNRETAETEERETREAERRKLRARAGGVRSTLLSNPGTSGNPGNLLGINQSMG